MLIAVLKMCPDCTLKTGKMHRIAFFFFFVIKIISDVICTGLTIFYIVL